MYNILKSESISRILANKLNDNTLDFVAVFLHHNYIATCFLHLFISSFSFAKIDIAFVFLMYIHSYLLFCSILEFPFNIIDIKFSSH